MIEGIFEFIILLVIGLCHDTFESTKILFEKNNTPGKMSLLIFLLIFILIVSGVNNAYRVYCNVIYTPMMKSLIDYLLVPIINIFLYFFKNDFYNSLVYFLISEIFSLIVGFFGCVFNEFIILFCFGLQHDTKFDISKRAISANNIPTEYILDEDNSENNNLENNDNEIQLV